MIKTMPIDPNNPVVQLCTAGMQAEAEGRMAEAHRLFLQAWAACQDDFDACIAAHFVARHQGCAEDALYWNQRALTHADAVGDERVQGFYSSLHLNLGWCYEQLSEWEAARQHYDLAAAQIEDAGSGPYGEVVQKGVAMAQQRLGVRERQEGSGATAK
jgi:tetratricopeptide (TPR) repeat protein